VGRPTHRGGFFKTPHTVVDDLLPTLSGAETKVLLLLIRYTAGWHRTTATFSSSYVAQGTGLTQKTAIKALDSLIANGVIEEVAITTEGKVYRVCIADGASTHAAETCAAGVPVRTVEPGPSVADLRQRIKRAWCLEMGPAVVPTDAELDDLMGTLHDAPVKELQREIAALAVHTESGASGVLRPLLERRTLVLSTQPFDTEAVPF
jgi:hypothetical protein